MTTPDLSEQIEELTPGEPFAFLCHKDIDCFTHCCRQLELALSPYDVLRLRTATGLHSAELLDRYIIREQEPNETFPRFYLSMVDDSQSSCIFVGPEGCRIYEHRPGACRMYPMGRAAIWKTPTLEERYVLLREPHCHGFREKTIQTASSYTKAQGLESYNRFNDMFAEITQHEQVRPMQLTEKQEHIYTLGLYNLDDFLSGLKKIAEKGRPVPERVFTDDEALLIYGLEWVKRELFGI